MGRFRRAWGGSARFNPPTRQKQANSPACQPKLPWRASSFLVDQKRVEYRTETLPIVIPSWGMTEEGKREGKWGKGRRREEREGGGEREG